MAQDPRALLQKVSLSTNLFTPTYNDDKAVQGAGGGFSLFGGRQEKWENAADLYTQAANAFRMQKQGKEAGLAFERAATIQTKNLNEPDDAANSLTEAFKTYRKTDPEDAARVLEQAITHYTMKGNFRRAATHKQNLAEVFEVEIGDQKRAIEAYETAAGWFEGDNAEALANKLFLKVADLAATEGDYYKSIEQYEKVARSSVNNNLMKWSVKDYFLKAGMCHLATGDMVATNRALETYRELDPAFASTREHQLLADLAGAVEQGDQEIFADKLFEFDRMSKLDKWKTTILLRVKNGIEEKGEDFS
ncbi:MAG: vesicular-fusion protein S17 [Piccolia ochrophora]|nr:MAG: vesicular-fusion protein S17 [Piccolia ochrophora]